MLIYLSSVAIKSKYINICVETLARNNFRCIELSGGTQYYERIEEDLLYLKKIYNLSYLCHNYFPPPPKHFVMNLASLNNDVYLKSIEQAKNAIELSKKLEAKKYGVHAGFFIDLELNEIGNKVKTKKILNREQSYYRFCSALDDLRKEPGDIDIYIENNVLSKYNSNNYDTNPFMLTTYEDYVELTKLIKFKLLLDVGHLKVTCKSLGLDFHSEFKKFVNHSDYLHLSDNDGFSDQHSHFNFNSEDNVACELIGSVKELGYKHITLEMITDTAGLKQSYDIVNRILEC